MINILNFGAIGDGVFDCTNAIKKAVVEQTRKTTLKLLPSGYYRSIPTIYFPSGEYLVSDTFQVQGGWEADGAVIKQQDPTKDILYCDHIWRLRLKGITFVGGKSQVHVGNTNVNDQSLIEDCVFQESSDAAIRIMPGTISTHATFRNCTFLECEQAVISYCDGLTLRDSWITSSSKMQDKAVIENRGMWLTVQDTFLCPTVNLTYNQRWIDNHGDGILASNVRFGGEGGGFTPIINWSKFDSSSPIWPRYVILDKCQVYSRSSYHSAIHCEEIPNQLAIRDCHGLINLNLVTVRPDITADYFKVPNFRPEVISLSVSSNVEILSTRGTGVPEVLVPYRE